VGDFRPGDPESFHWNLLVVLCLLVAPTIGMLTQAKFDGSRTASATAHVWVMCTGILAYPLAMLPVSPANHPLIYGVAEMLLLWCTLYCGVNSFMIGCISVGHCETEFRRAESELSDEERFHLLFVQLTWHVGGILLYMPVSVTLVLLLRPRADAPAWCHALRTGKEQFLSEYGWLAGSLLALPVALTSLPSGTCSYALSRAGYFVTPPARVYEGIWNALYRLHFGLALLDASVYAGMCLVSHGRLASASSWFLLMGTLNCVCAALCVPRHRRRIRRLLFPLQASDAPPAGELPPAPTQAPLGVRSSQVV